MVKSDYRTPVLAVFIKAVLAGGLMAPSLASAPELQKNAFFIPLRLVSTAASFAAGSV
jgi:hypothetical protein